MEVLKQTPLGPDPQVQPLRLKEKRSYRTGFRESKWQKKLLPYMITVLSLVMLFFFTASAFQLYYLHQRIERSPELNLNPALIAFDGTPATTSEKGRLEMGRWKTLSILEGNALQRRYHQANVLLMSRIWTGYLGFVTGMILALVGATFILGKLRESETQVNGGSDVWKFSMTTASPGLVLALLGTILMVTTMVSHHEIKVDDGQLYTAGWNTTANPSPPDREDALPPPSTFPAEREDEVIKTGDSKTKETKKAESQLGDN